jgi:hypothetical protein
MVRFFMNSVAQVLATLFIWGASSAMVTAFSIQNNVSGFNFVILIAIVMASAVSATRFVWRGPAAAAVEAAYSSSEKTKRAANQRLQRVMNSLSDDEIAELRARLSADDEMVPLESLMRKKSS